MRRGCLRFDEKSTGPPPVAAARRTFREGPRVGDVGPPCCGLGKNLTSSRNTTRSRPARCSAAGARRRVVKGQRDAEFRGRAESETLAIVGESGCGQIHASPRCCGARDGDGGDQSTSTPLHRDDPIEDRDTRDHLLDPDGVPEPRSTRSKPLDDGEGRQIIRALEVLRRRATADGARRRPDAGASRLAEAAARLRRPDGRGSCRAGRSSGWASARAFAGGARIGGGRRAGLGA